MSSALHRIRTPGAPAATRPVARNVAPAAPLAGENAIVAACTVAVGVTVGVRGRLGVAVGVSVGSGGTLLVGVTVPVGVAVDGGVAVTVPLGVAVWSIVAVGARLGVPVGVGVAHTPCTQTASGMKSPLAEAQTDSETGASHTGIVNIP